MAELNDRRIGIQVAERKHNQLQSAINLCSQRLPAYQWFESQGIRGEDLKVLFDKVPDISLLHEVPFHVAFNKFFGDVSQAIRFKVRS